MGRDRLRRGYSLEVIFEEDSDFCSHLDSLDPQTHPRRTKKGDLFSIDTLFSELSSTYPPREKRINGYCSERIDDFKSLDGFLDLSLREMDSCFTEWDEFSGDSMRSDRTMSFYSQEHLSDSSPSTVSGRRSRVSRRQIVEASWVMDDEEVFTPPIETFDDINEPTRVSNNFLQFDMDSSTLTEETYAAIDQFDEQHSLSVVSLFSTSAEATTTNKFSWNSSRDGSQKSNGSPSYGNFLPGDNSYQKSKSLLNMDIVSSSTDVKRVRALFENSSASSSEDETNFSRSKFNKANHTTSCKRLKECNSNTINSNYGNNSNSNTMRSAYSHLSLNQMDRCDFADLLVNDKVIIEDSPDIYQMFRLRHRDNLGGTSSKLSSSSTSTFSRSSTLRRSKSVGAGIHYLDEDENMSIKNPSSSTEDVNKDRPCILAEEMPAPDTVKNVRTVFERLYQKSRVNSQENVGPTPSITMNKSLSSIRSNPTSKILRSESMRNDINRVSVLDESNTNIKPINFTTNTLKKTQEISKVFEPKKIPLPPTPKVSIPKTLSKVWPDVSQRQRKPSLTLEEVTEENNSLPSTASNTTMDENEDRKLISCDVLNRIRSCGTTTTYFGGEIVAKTVKNRKLAITPRKNIENTYEFENSSSEINYPTEEIFFSARSNQNLNIQDKFSTSSSRRPFDLQFNLQNTPHVDTAPRIISVLPKSQSNSPTKSNSPVGSLIEGRNSPEGCESQFENSHPEWINDPTSPTEEVVVVVPTELEVTKPEDSNNNSIKYAGERKAKSNKFSEAAEGAWF